MKLKKLHIRNFKSIVDLEINEPSPFTVFVGPNGAGKSNIFEALEFSIYASNIRDVESLFGGVDIYNDENLDFKIIWEFERYKARLLKYGAISKTTKKNLFETFFIDIKDEKSGIITKPFEELPQSIQMFFSKNPRLFIKNENIVRLKLTDDKFLSPSATSNLEKVLKRILQNDTIKDEIFDWLTLFVPEFKNIEIHNDKISGQDTLIIFERHSKRPFSKSLISDGIYNILALLTAVYQSDEPQFLCIEEPENGLNPFVIRKLVDFFRQACEDKGHYIWLNSHSQTLVECLTPEEIIVVDKVGGETKIKQIKGMNLHGLDMAEVWLSGALGGGTPW